MKISELMKRVEKEDFFQDFKEENPESYFSALLCILTKNESEGDKIQLDFFMPQKKQIAITEYPFICMTYPEDKIESMQKLENGLNFDLTDLWEIVEKAKNSEEIKHDTNKIIGVLKDNKWLLTCLDNTLGMLKINLDADTGKITKVEKSSIKDMIKINKKPSEQ
jgi:hypothetical protein